MASEAAQKVCALAGCDMRFTPTRKTQVFCTVEHGRQFHNDTQRRRQGFADRICERDGCQNSYTPDRKNARYCSRSCATMASNTVGLPPVVVPDDIDLGDGTDPALRAALNKALRKLEEARVSKAELVQAVEDAAAEAIHAMDIPPVPAPKADRRKHPEIAVIDLSDWQLGKVTPSYTSEICEQRIQRLADKIVSLTEIQRADHPVTECRVYLLGDLGEGELIFPGQAHRIDASLFRQTVVDGPRILGNFLRRMAACFERVHVAGVIGNHGALGGRARKDYHPESNADAMMYEITRLLLEDEPRVTWAPNLVKGERNWYALDDVGAKRFFLFHGDQVKGGFAGFPWYGFGKKLLGWNRLYGFDYAVSGHFHTPVRGYYNGIVHWGNGSTESDNTYAAENMAAAGEPCQWLRFVHPATGVTSEYLVRVA